MPTKNTFRRLATKFETSTFADFFQHFTFTMDSSAAYDPITGQYSHSGTTYSITCCRLDYDNRQVDGDKILVGDRKLISRVDIWEALGLVPRVNSGSVSVDGEDYQIISIMKDAADALYTLQIRRL